MCGNTSRAVLFCLPFGMSGFSVCSRRCPITELGHVLCFQLRLKMSVHRTHAACARVVPAFRLLGLYILVSIHNTVKHAEILQTPSRACFHDEFRKCLHIVRSLSVYVVLAFLLGGPYLFPFHNTVKHAKILQNPFWDVFPR